MRFKKITAGIICAAMLFSLLAVSAAAAPIIVDFSANDFVMGGIGNAEHDYINDGDRRVLFVEVTDGFDPEVDDEGSTKGDPNGSIDDFAAYDLDGDRYKYMVASIKNESGAPFFEIHFSSPSSGYAVATSVNFGIEPNSDYTKYIWSVEEWYERYYPKRSADHPQGGTDDPFFNHWSGHINQLRLDFMYYTEPGGQARTGDKIYVEYIAFVETLEEAEAFTFRPARTPASIEEAREAAQAERDAAAEAAQQEEQEEAAAQEPEADGASDDEAAPAPEAADDNPAANNNNDSASSDESGGNTVIIIVIVAVVIVAVVIIAVITSKKKKAA